MFAMEPALIRKANRVLCTAPETRSRTVGSRQIALLIDEY